MPVVNLLSFVFRRMSNLTGVHLCSCCKYNAAIEELNACDPQSTVCLLDQELSSLEGDGDY
ncbi:MAG: hypothetical protein IT292_01360 [Deltaproteobacteria bacterium]|nr:hypothetical protein [Deltaproteobacteria bacterium]